MMDDARQEAMDEMETAIAYMRTEIEEAMGLIDDLEYTVSDLRGDAQYLSDELNAIVDTFAGELGG